MFFASRIFAGFFATGAKVCVFGAFVLGPTRAIGASHVCMNRAKLPDSFLAITLTFDALTRIPFLGGAFLVATRWRGDDIFILDLQYLRIHILNVGEWALFGARWIVIVCKMLIIIF